MSTLLIRHIDHLVTMDHQRREIRDAGIFVRNGLIDQLGETKDLPETADDIVDLRGHIVLPGLVNAHHHLFQSLDRCSHCNAGFVDWLKGLYSRWAHMRPETVQLAVEVGLSELALSGCTTVADHNYLWPNGLRPGHLMEAADSVGLRYHLGCGFQDVSLRNGGFAPDHLADAGPAALRRCADAVEAFHDPSPGSLRQVFIAPSSIRSVTPELLREAASLARSLDVGFHMHLAETVGETAFTQERFGRTPVEAAHDLGCLGEKSWIAHAVHLSESDRRLLADSQCGLCHCPSSNMRLGAGLAPVEAYLKAGIKVGLGVDGAASNDGSNLIGEARLAMLLARIAPGSSAPLFSPRSALEVATLGGASLLSRRDIGALEVGRAADLISIDLSRIEMLGSEQDPVASTLLCSVNRVDNSWVHGRQIVARQRLVRESSPNLPGRVRAWNAELAGIARATTGKVAVQ